MKKIIFLVLVSIGLQAQAKLQDLRCEGVDREGRALTIIWDEWKDNRSSARVDLTVDVEGVGPRTTVDLYVYGGDEGFDYGVTSSNGSFMFHLVEPYGESNPKEIRGDYYYGGKFDLDSRVFLKCKPTRLPKKY